MHSWVNSKISGIGIDDMFVIVQCLSNLEQKDSKWLDKPIEELVGETMRHAGVAITITSLTDFIVFMVGASTVGPQTVLENHSKNPVCFQIISRKKNQRNFGHFFITTDENNSRYFG